MVSVDGPNCPRKCATKGCGAEEQLDVPYSVEVDADRLQFWKFRSICLASTLKYEARLGGRHLRLLRGRGRRGRPPEHRFRRRAAHALPWASSIVAVIDERVAPASTGMMADVSAITLPSVLATEEIEVRPRKYSYCHARWRLLGRHPSRSVRSPLRPDLARAGS